MITYPFWLVLPHETDVDTSAFACEMGTRPLAFSSVQKMNAYLSARKEGQWNVRLINRYSSLAVLAELLAEGYTSIYFDVDRSGNEGQEIPLDDILHQRKANDR